MFVCQAASRRVANPFQPVGAKKPPIRVGSDHCPKSPLYIRREMTGALKQVTSSELLAVTPKPGLFLDTLLYWEKQKELSPYKKGNH